MRRTTTRTTALIACLGTAAFLPAACGSANAQEDASGTKEIGYTARGRVLSITNLTGKPAYQIFHEEIPGYVQESGELGMKAMPMEFTNPLAVSDGVEAGDPVEVRFRVGYDAETNQVISITTTEITELPAETILQIKMGTDGTPDAAGDCGCPKCIAAREAAAKEAAAKAETQAAAAQARTPQP